MSGRDVDRFPPSTPQRILVVKLSSLGDIVHVTPCLRGIRRSFPGAKIVMAVEGRYAAVVRHNPHLDDLIESPPANIGAVGFIRGTLKALARYRGRPFDLAIDFQGTRRSAAWVYASRAAYKAGRGRVRPAWDRAVLPDLSRHAIRVCAEIAGLVGIRVDDLTPEIFLSEHDETALSSLLREQGWPEEGFLVINPFSRWASKAWPLDRQAELISRLGQRFAIPVVVSGGPGEEDQAAELVGLLPPGSVLSLAGKLTLGQALCLFRRARLMITGDTGPMHAAAALGTRVVALFGPTLPDRTGPWGDGHRVIQARRPASHYAYRADREGTMIRAIDVPMVFEAVIASLKDQFPA
jgi:ADP-heptose:LPS heptosyltransferase